MGIDESNDEGPTGILPQWETPAPLDGETDRPGNSSRRFLPPESGAGGGDGSPFGRRTRRPDRAGLRTPTSSLGEGLREVKKPDAKQATALVVGLLGLVVGGVGWVVQRRAGRKLRKPTEVQTEGVAEPLARILVRRADLTLLGPDLADIIAAGAAFGDYLNDGPLLEGPAVDPGVPADLTPVIPLEES